MRRLGWWTLLWVCIGLVACGGRGRAPFADTYDECVVDSDCIQFPDDLCYTVYGTDFAGMCTTPCTRDVQCPFEWSVCEAIDGSSGLCYETCLDDAECAVGWGCFSVDQGRYIVDVCLPI